MFVVVLGGTLAITVIGLSALMLVRVERVSAQEVAELSTAKFLAQSAIEFGQYKIRQDSTWRKTYSSGVWSENVPLGTGTFTLEGIDTVDGDLNNSSSDPVVLRGTGMQGSSVYKLEVTMAAKSNALTCLQTAMHAGGNLSFSSATVQSNAVTISTNGSSMTAGPTTVYPKVEAVGGISGAGYQSSKTSGVAARTMPDATVFDYYKTNGTAILYSSIFNVQGKKTMEKKVLSPASNPYGMAKNPKGIYVIDCALGDLRVRDLRIVGTLVILNPGTFSIENSVQWEPAVANYPSLMVSGAATFNYTNTALSESSTGVNFNPSGTPFQGVSDIDFVDTYASEINGLVYVSGAVTTQSAVTIKGVLVVGTTLTSQNTLNLSYSSTFLSDPPPGFGSASGMAISLGTWKQLVN